MFDIKDILLMVKQAALDIYNAQKPMEVCFGTVESIDPLTIRVEQKMLLESNQLILTNNVKYHIETLKLYESEARDYAVFNDLKQGEKVILNRVQGGQKYLVLDRV